MKKLISICFLAGLSTFANAQSLVVTTEVTSHDERAVVEYSGMKCATEGATVLYKIGVGECDSIENVSVCKYDFNSTTYEASYTLDKGVITIDDLTPSLIKGDNELTFHLSIKEKGKEALTELTGTATTVQVYPIPTHQEVTAPLYVVFYKETGKLVWSANGEGGAKWEYSWSSTGNVAGSSATFTHPSIVNNDTSEKNIAVTLKATNYAPDGTTVWDSYSGNWAIKILPAATVTLKVAPNTEEDPNRKFQGDSWILGLSTGGGNLEGWKIEWRDGDTVVGQGSDYKVTSSATGSIVTKHIVAHVTNSAPEGADPGKGSWYDESYHYYVRFYPVPEVVFAESYPQNVMDGEKIQMAVEFVGSTLDNDYVFNCKWDGKADQSGQSYLYEASNSNNNFGTQKTVTVEYSFGLINSDVKSETKERSHTFTVWPKPSVNTTAQNSSSDPYRQFQDGKWDLSVSSSGGYRTGWSYEWKDDDGNVLGRGEKYTLKCDKKSDEIQEKHVILTVKNQAQDRSDVWFEETYHYYANFYPAPIVEFEKDYPKNIKDEDVVTLALTVQDAHGNTLGDAYDIGYSWDNGKSKDASYSLVGDNKTNDNGVNKTVIVNCTVQLKGQNVKQTYTRQADFVVWPKPQINATGISDRVGCGGQSLDFSVITNGGKKDGWSYEWTQNNQRLDETTSNYKLVLNNAPTEGSILNRYKVRVKNVCDGEVWKDEEFLFNVTVYPEPRIPADIVAWDKNREAEVTTGIREGNDLILQCEECTGGYPNAWSYKWMRNNSELSTEKDCIEKVPAGYSGDGKADDLQYVYSCYVENLYNTIPWAQHNYEKEVKVYHKPKTPTSLRKKGNGTSNTWIATCGIDDASLGTYDYYLVFGYRDADGNLHDVSSVRQQNVGEQRWSTQMQSVEGRSNAYVYALWKYSDGAEITSGLCLESHVEEAWDGSTYNGATRSVIADITGISDFPSIAFGSEKCEYYSVSGQKMGQSKNGLNIIRLTDGQVIKVINNK